MSFKSLFPLVILAVIVLGVVVSSMMVGYSRARLDSLYIIDQSVKECEQVCINKSLEFDNGDLFAFSCATGCYETAMIFLEKNKNE